MTDAATKIVKATELNIGRRAEEYYYIHLDDLLTTAEGNNPQKIPTLGTLAMVNAKKAALALKKEAEKKAKEIKHETKMKRQPKRQFRQALQK